MSRTHIAAALLLALGFATSARLGPALGSSEEAARAPVDPRIRYSSYLGGPAGYVGRALALDGHGHIFVSGSINGPTAYPPSGRASLRGSRGTAAREAPLTRPALSPGILPWRQTGGFVAKIDLTHNRVDYRVYLPGQVTSIAVDRRGNAYVTGFTSSSRFPLVHAIRGWPGSAVCRYDIAAPPPPGSSQSPPGLPCQHAFATKISSAGKLVFSTYLAGNHEDEGQGIAVDAFGNTYVVGSTGSTNFPVHHAVQSRYAGPGPQVIDVARHLVDQGCCDAFVAKLSPMGSLVWSTYLGGSKSDSASGVAVDQRGNVYLAGSTDSPDFPTFHPLQAAKVPTTTTFRGDSDAFLTKLSPSGRLLYSTYLGGNSGDAAADIAVDSAGDMYVAGTTSSTNFPTTPHALQRSLGTAPGFGGGSKYCPAPCADAFVSKLNPNGSRLLYSTYLGGSAYEAAYGLALTRAGRAVVVGRSDSLDFPLVHPIKDFPPAHSPTGQGGFLAELDPSGSQFLFSTLTGGTLPYEVAVDRTANAYMTGALSTLTPQFYLVRPIQARPSAGNTYLLGIHLTPR